MQRNDQSISPDASTADDGRRAHIALFLKGFGPGGVERIALRLTDGWRRTGLDVDVTAATAAGPMQGPGAGYRIARFWPIIGARWPMARLTLSIWRRARRAPPALLFCPGNSYTIVAVMLRLLLGRNCPPIVAKISNDLHRRDLPRAIRPLYRLWLILQGRLIDHFAVLSPAMGREVAGLMQVPASRIHIVPNPVLGDADLMPTGLPQKPRGAGRRFVAVGRLERQKDYPSMLRAFAAGAGPDDRLTIYGEGSARDALATLVAALPIAERVHLAGYSGDVRAALRDHDILLLSSRYEGQPGAVVEALSVGLGIIATRCCAGMPDLLDHGALGTLVDRGDGAAFARAIAQAMPGQQNRERARIKARAFTIEAALPAYATLFATVIAERHARQGTPRRPAPFRPATNAEPA
jgi:glycosyltransferase involved in cell wall biosynthesis